MEREEKHFKCKSSKITSVVRRYKKEWESDAALSGWLSPIIGDDTKAFCKVCKCQLQPHKKDLLKHGICKKHKEALKHSNISTKCKKITGFIRPEISEKRKIIELRIASFIAEHCSIKTSDHLGCLIKGLDENSIILKELKLHRTKCTALIKNVLQPCLLHDLINDVGENYYSLIIDESTSIDTKKLLCIMIRYFSERKKKIETTFYRLVEIEGGDAVTITTTFKQQLEKDGLDIKKLVGIGVDGANVIVGQHNSFSSILKSTLKELVVVKCVCHSLHLAAEHACKTLPRCLDFIVKECHNWFAQSTKRQIDYRLLYETMNNTLPLKIDKLSGRRWLARNEAVMKVLEQWDALKLHFALAKDKERCYIAEQLHNLLSSNVTKLYLLFLSNILKPLVGINRLFQTNNTDPLKLLRDLHSLLYSYLQIIVVPAQLAKVKKENLSSFKFQEYVMGTNCINFGYSFTEYSQNVSKEELLDVKNRCKDFLCVLCEQLQLRIPENIHILEKINMLSPEYATAQVKPDITNLVATFRNVCVDIDKTLQEWNELSFTQWTKVHSTEEFWFEVFSDQNAAGQPRFAHISKLALALLSLPFSNAAVERAFSIVNIIKDKLRNRMAVSTADAIMMIRFSMKDQWCYNFISTQEMLKKFNSEELYVSEIDHDEVLDVFPD